MGDAPTTGLHVLIGIFYREISKLAHEDDFDMMVMSSDRGDLLHYEIGPKLARPARNAICYVLALRN